MRSGRKDWEEQITPPHKHPHKQTLWPPNRYSGQFSHSTRAHSYPIDAGEGRENAERGKMGERDGVIGRRKREGMNGGDIRVTGGGMDEMGMRVRGRGLDVREKRDSELL